MARQTVEFIARDRRHAQALTERTSAAAPAMTAAIARVLDALDRPERRVRLDVVEIDLGACDPAHWEAALVAGIERELATTLRAALAAPGAEPSDAPPAALELLMVFARSGRLPWWAGAADLPGTAVKRLAAEGAAPEAVRRLLALPGAVERLVRQLDDGALASLAVLALLPADAPVAAQAARLGAEMAQRLERTSTVERRELWAAVLRQVAQGLPAEPPPGAAPSSVPPETVDRPQLPDIGPRGAAADSPPAVLAARLEAFARRWPHAADPVRHLAAIVAGLDAGTAEAALRLLGVDAGPEPAALAAVVAALQAAGMVSRDEAQALHAALAVAQPPADPHDAIAVDCAGLPLLVPFLPAFFDGLDLLEDRDFRGEAARHRAVGLLHFLASGALEAPEPLLPLAKLLAGLPLDAMHEPAAPLEAREIAAGEALLAAVIGHAPMLGRISTAGLRASFLMRPGTLTTRDGHWLLRVERRSFDVLLDRLPWSFNWVRLPWMTAPLQIEW
ncbi:MAG: contractile injection system tape measure protein [Xanthobacteraceae bacterium]